MCSREAQEIDRFSRNFGSGESALTRIGDGELGGKAAGLLQVQRDVLSRFAADEFPRFEVAVPSLVVLATELFDQFMTSNDLYPVALSGERDDVIAHAFQQAKLPTTCLGDLRSLATSCHTPLAIRSSSLLEDALAHPFAGVYATKMIPNNQPAAEVRFERLAEGIKFVFASAFFGQARSYLRSIGRDPSAEKMAVIIQEIVGQRCDERFYPGLSGVARSYNYYPSGHAQPEDGVVNLALGLGKQIVDGGSSWTYCPAHPKAPPPFNSINDLLKNSQTEYWAVNMGKPPLPDPIQESEFLVRAGLKEAEYDGTLDLLISTYDGRSDRLRPGTSSAGPRLLNFAPLLEYDVLPLNDLLRTLLRHAEEVSGAPVEIEFAMTTKHGSTEPHRFGFLQMRPMMVADSEIEVSDAELTDENVLLASDIVLGNGCREDIHDVVFVKPDRFDAKYTSVMAAEIEQVNRALVESDNPYLLIGFGRWGSSDPWLGIPVEWGAISGARVIVESSLPNMHPDLSQGSHFFHNLIGFHVLYLATGLRPRCPIAWQWLEQQPTIQETEFVKHIRTERPLRIKVDGRRRRGFIGRGQD